MSRIWLLPALIFVAFLAILSYSYSAPADAQTVMPDGISFVDNATVLPAGSGNYTIIVQLTLRGANYSGNNFGVYFQSSDLSILDIPRGTSAVSDGSGIATLNVTVGQNTGNVTVTASLLSPDGAIHNSKTYPVMGFGNIGGTIVDTAGNGIPGATVTLYSLNNSTKGDVLPISGNPATTSEQGAYAINNVSYGSYILEAVIDSEAANISITVAGPAETANISVQGYYVPTPTPSPTPSPTPTETASPTVTPVPASPTPAPKESTGDSMKQLTWILAAALVLAVIIIGATLLRKKPKK